MLGVNMIVTTLFEVFGFDTKTNQKKTISAYGPNPVAVRDHLRKVMPHFTILAIYPEVQ